MKYTVIPQDIDLARAQLENLNGDRTVWDIFTKFDNIKYRVVDLKYLKTKKSVRLSLVRATFDFGDGYYTAYSPTPEDRRHEELELNNPQLKRIINNINKEWEEEHLDGLEYFEFPQMYIDAMHRRDNVKKSISVLEEDINAYLSYIKSNKETTRVRTEEDDLLISDWETNIDYLKQLKAVVARERTLNTLQKKESLRDFKHKKWSKAREEIFAEVTQYYEDHPMPDEQLKRVSILSKNERKSGYTFKYTEFRWKTTQPDWHILESGRMNKNLIIEQIITPPEGYDKPYTVHYDPRDIVIKREVNKKLEEQGFEALELIESDKEEYIQEEA